MAATVQGIFRIIDQATRPMERMERQAIKTDAAIRSLGDATDNVGTNRQARQFGSVERSLRNVERSARLATGTDGGGGMRGFGRSTRNAGNDSDHLSNRLRKLAGAFAGLKSIVGLMKFPAIIAGVGALVQVVGALGAGAVSLLPKIADLSGVLGALPSTLAAVGIGVGTVKLAFSGLTKAMQGNKKALASLTPEGRQFLATLKSYHPVIQKLRESAQRGLFPGLDQALRKLRGGTSTFQELVGGMGSAIGRVASDAAGKFTSKSFLSDLRLIGQQADVTALRAGHAFINIVDALRQVAVAARPFTNWLTKTMLGWTRWADAAATAGRESGRLAKFFERTKNSLKTFGDILHNVWITLRNIGQAARPLGNSLYESIDKATKRWMDFTGSFSGQAKMRLFFEQMREPIRQTFGLVSDLAKALVQLSSSPQTTGFLQKLRDAVPVLEKLIQDITATFGPVLLDSLFQVAQMFETVVTPMGEFGRLLNSVLKAVNMLLQNVPGLKSAVAGLIAIMTFRKVLGPMTAVIGKWRELGGAIAGTEAVAAGSAVAGGGAARGAGGKGFLPFLLGGGRGAPVIGGSAGTLEGGATRLGMGAAAAGLARTGLRAAGKFALPVAALFAATDFLTTPGSVVNRGQAALHGASFGAIPGPATTDKGLQAANNYVAKLSNDPRAAIGAIQRQIGRLGADRHGFGVSTGVQPGRGFGIAIHDDNKKMIDAEVGALRKELETRKQIVHQIVLGQREQRKAEAQQKATSAIADLQKAFPRFIGKGGKGADAFVGAVTQQLNMLPGQAKHSVAQAALNMVREQARQNPKLWQTYRDLRQQVVNQFELMNQKVKVVNGRILTGTQGQWNTIASTIGSAAFSALDSTSKAFRRIQQIAMGELETMGFSPAQARNVFQAASGSARQQQAAATNTSEVASGKVTPDQVGGVFQNQFANKKARGGRIGGRGLMDTVPLGGAMAAPGELVVNRHTEASVNSMLPFGATLGGLVHGEGRKHSQAFARGGRYPGLHPGIARAVQSVLGHFPGLAVTSTTGGKHAAGSYHYLGEAADIAGPPALMNTAAAWIGRAMGGSLTEGIHNPNLSIKFGKHVSPGFWGASTWAGHANHIHLAVAGALGKLMGGGGGGIHIPRQRSGAHGVLGLIADTAIEGVRRGATRKANALANTLGGGDLPGAGGMTSAGGTFGRGRLMKLWDRAGGDPSMAHLMAAIALAESGGNPNIVNGIGATGLWQIHPGGSQYLNPMVNARTAVGKLASQGLGAWETYTNGSYRQFMARGGRVPEFGGWFGGGGQIVANRPTLIGVGEKGTETVTVSRGGGKGGGRPITVHIGNIVNHRAGDIKGHIKREVREAFDELSRELDRMPMESEEALT